MNYKKLLALYVKHVNACAGMDYLGNAYIPGPQPYKIDDNNAPRTSTVKFTPEEIEYLRKLGND
jgi:hypothetical protein